MLSAFLMMIALVYSALPHPGLDSPASAFAGSAAPESPALPPQNPTLMQGEHLKKLQQIQQSRQQADAAARQIQLAESQLRSAISELQALQAKGKGSPEVSSELISLQNLLAQVQAIGKEGSAPAPSLADEQAEVDAMVGQANRMTVLSQKAQTYALQGVRLAQVTETHLPLQKNIPAPAVAAPPDVQQPKPASAGPPAAEVQPHHGQEAGTSGLDAESVWFNKLRNGLMQYTVPSMMQWKVSSTVTVQVLGERSPAMTLDHQNGQAPIKVARHMKVQVTAPDNPDEFIIAPEADTQLEQPVPEEGFARWNFSVTPRYTAPSQKLVVETWVIYNDGNAQELLPVYEVAVDVHVPGFVECVKRLLEGDPDYWVKYGLPGGGGFAFLGTLAAAWWKWQKGKKRTQQSVAP